MVALHRSGRRADALATYRPLPPGPGRGPGHRPVSRAQEPPRRHRHRRGAVSRGAVTSSGPGRVRRRAPFGSRLIGRDPLVAEVVALLDEERLVTLLGTGGIGKTRVAAEVARRAGGDVWFCELAAAEETSVVATVASATGVDLTAGVGLLERIVDLLAERRGLLVLDNCEHVLDAVAKVAEAVLAGPRPSASLATSRERLALDGEHLSPVPLLPPPAGDRDEPAVRLFVDRARAVQPAWSPSDAEVAQIAEVCRRLDGLPLAIELAAARLHTLTLDEVATGLATRFRLLTGGRRTTARHRSLASRRGLVVRPARSPGAGAVRRRRTVPVGVPGRGRR
jgi:hypothetical protein